MTGTPAVGVAVALVRSASGKVAHRADCPHARRPGMVPWRWAEGRTLTEVAAAAASVGVHGCRVCRPFEVAA